MTNTEHRTASCALYLKSDRQTAVETVSEIFTDDSAGLSGFTFTTEPHGTNTLQLMFSPWPDSVEKADEAARTILEKHPGANLEGWYLDGSGDRCGGYATYDKDKDVHVWNILPDDWDAYLKGDYQNTSQAKRKTANKEK